MRKLFLLLRFYYRWQLSIVVSAVIGCFAFLLKIALAGYRDNLTFFLGLLSYCFLFIIPFFSSATALRQFLSKPQLVMVPGLGLCAGLAHFTLAVFGSLFLYINFRLFAPTHYDLLTLVRIFVVISFCAGYLQWILPSRFFVPLISFTPMLFVMLTLHFRTVLGQLFFDPAFTWGLLLLTIAGWGYGWHLLTTRHRFRPPFLYPAIAGPAAWDTFQGTLLSLLPVGRARTPQGTLLLGYPDNWGGIVSRIAYYMIFTPLLTTLVMFLIGFGENARVPMLQSAVHLFLFISLFSAVLCIFMYGELAARARLLWLRYGTDRSTQWQLIDYFCRRFLLIYTLMALAIVLVAKMLAPLDNIIALHYLSIIVSYGCFNLYFSLIAKIYRLSSVVMGLVAVGAMLLIGLGLFFVTNDSIASYRPLGVFEAMMAVLGLAFRHEAKKQFATLDWQLVRCNRQPGRFGLTGDST